MIFNLNEKFSANLSQIFALFYWLQHTYNIPDFF
jgi:hypothetical protein